MKKRILILSPIYYPHYGGAEKAIFEICKGLSKKYDVDLLTPSFGGKKYEYNGFFNIHRVCKTSKFRVIKLFKYQFYQYMKAKELSKQYKYSLIHGHYLLPSGWVGLALKKLLKIPLIITEHHFGTGSDISSEKETPKFINKYMKNLAKKIDFFVSTGATQNKFLKFLNVKKSKIKTISLGGDCSVSKESKSELFRYFKLNPNKKVIFSISRLVYRKRYDILIESIKKLVKIREDFVVLIGGKGPELENLKKQIKSNNLEKYIILLGFISDKNLEKYRKISDIFVSTSEFEGAGIMYFESFAAKLPLFAKKNIASNEAIEDGVNGVLFSNSSELSRKLNYYLDKKDLLKELSSKGYISYKEKFNWNKCAQEYVNVYAKRIGILK